MTGAPTGHPDALTGTELLRSLAFGGRKSGPVLRPADAAWPRGDWLNRPTGRSAGRTGRTEDPGTPPLAARGKR